MAVTEFYRREVDGLLLGVASRVQLSPTKHEEADRVYHALCDYIGREDSPLHGLVVECYPGGSFATGTVIVSWSNDAKHDVDVIIELNIHPLTLPREALSLLFRAINGESGSRYHGKVEQRSRCVTVTYSDGVTVDLMPIARLQGKSERAGHLFHYKPTKSEEYHKEVNPWAFSIMFNDVVRADPSFAKSFREQIELDKRADTQPMPDQVPLSQKSPRVVALQLLKRFRDVRYSSRTQKKPPSIIMSALSLGHAVSSEGISSELLSLSGFVRPFLQSSQKIVVQNPAYPPDIFTDRWPADVEAQHLFATDLSYLELSIRRLINEEMSTRQMLELLRDLFGEGPAIDAVDQLIERRRYAFDTGALGFGSRGRVAASAVGLSAVSSAAKASTFTGGCSLD